MHDWIYITKARAIDSQLTHEGTLFGVPAWFAGDSDGEICMATPKMPILHAWCWLADKCLDLFAYAMPTNEMLVSPIHVTGRIK